MIDFHRHDNFDMIYDIEAYSSSQSIEITDLVNYKEIVNIRLVNELLDLNSVQESNLSGWINYEYLNGTDCHFYPNSGYPILRDFFYKGESGFMEEKKSKTEQESQQEKWEKNFKRIMEANQASKRTIFRNDNEMVEFIHSCEKFYNKTTDEHLLEHESREFEGNVDERRWYRFAKYLKEKGISF